MVKTGKNAGGTLPLPVDENALNADNQRLIRGEKVKTIAKRQLKLEDSLKCNSLQSVLPGGPRQTEATENWERTQREQPLHQLIQ